MTETLNPKKYDLEDRTMKFAKDIRNFVSRLPKTIANNEDSKQVIRSSGSVAANYIEANEALSKKDFVLRIKICRKEAKETSLWLNLIESGSNSESEKQRLVLVSETSQLMMIFSSIMRKSI